MGITVWSLDSFEAIDRVAEKAAPGRPPAYTAAHVLKALELIGACSGVGRQQLARELRLGEGTARTLVRRLRGEGLLEVSRGGMTLSGSGRRILSDVTILMAYAEVQEAVVTVGPRNYAVLVRGAADHIRLGVEQRDAALMAGAGGATTLLYDCAQFHMPSSEVELDPSLNRYLVDRLKPENGDVVIIGTAEDLTSAEIGARTAALELLRKMAARSDTH